MKMSLSRLDQTERMIHGCKMKCHIISVIVIKFFFPRCQPATALEVTWYVAVSLISLITVRGAESS